MRLSACVVLLAGLTHAAWARPRTLDIRIDAHPTFDEVAVMLPQAATLADVPQMTRQGDRLILALPGAGAVGIVPSLTGRHVLKLQGGRDQIVLTLQPGCTARARRVGRQVVVDVLASAAGAVTPVAASAPRGGQARPPAIAAAPVAPGWPAGTPTGPGGRLAGGLAGAPDMVIRPGAGGAGPGAPGSRVPTPETHAAHAAPGEPPPSALPRPPEPPDAPGTPEDAASAPGPLDGAEALRAVRLPGPGNTVLLPFDPKVGAAAFAAFGLGHVVFDENKAIDLAALKDDPVFASARITLAPGSTHLAMTVPPGARLSLHRQPEGWAVTLQAQPPDRTSAPVRLRGERLIIAMKQAARAVVLADPVTGAKLLVGTVHDHGDGIVVPHVSAEFRLLQSWEGVAVGVVSDRLALDVIRDGFSLGMGSGAPLATVMADSTQAALESVGSLTRRFDIPPLSVAALRERLDSDVATAARAPRQARFGPRLLAARDMLGLGMAREAAALITTARNDDPVQAARPDAAALLAMADWLSNAPGASPFALGAIDNPGLGGSDEVALWRALLPPRGPAGPVEALAAVVAADWRLLAAYPPPLRARLMPRAAAILIEGKAHHEAAALLATGQDIPMEGVRAQLLAAQGRTGEVLAILDRLADGPDRKAAAAALRDGTEMRLRAGAIKPAEAARTLARDLYAWREPGFEIDRRLRIAALLVQAGDFRGALAGLREADALFPQAHAQVRAAEDDAIAALLRIGAGTAMAPLDLLALVADNADLIGSGNVAASLTPVLVDKLTALDLPERADVLVGKLIENTADPLPKAMLGTRLAALRLDQEDAPGALAALDQTMAGGLPAELDTRRAVMRARALIKLGEDGPALSLLAAHDEPDSWSLAAQLHEKAHDWRAADLMLQKLVRAGVPATGALSAAQQDLVLRLASAASQAGDTATLAALSAGAARQLSPGPRADLFAALTVQPVRDIADLPRAQRDAVAARTLPAAWAGYAAH